MSRTKELFRDDPVVDPYKKLRRKYPDATDAELEAIKRQLDFESHRKKWREPGDLDPLERVRIENSVQNVIMGILERNANNMSKTAMSKEAAQRVSNYMDGYYHGYLLSKEAGGEDLGLSMDGPNWLDSLMKNWQHLNPEYRRWISAALMGLVGGGVGAGLSGMMGGGRLSGPIGVLAAMLGAYGGYNAVGKQDYIKDLIDAANKGYRSLTGTSQTNNMDATGEKVRERASKLQEAAKDAEWEKGQAERESQDMIDATASDAMRGLDNRFENAQRVNARKKLRNAGLNPDAPIVPVSGVSNKRGGTPLPPVSANARRENDWLAGLEND